MTTHAEHIHEHRQKMKDEGGVAIAKRVSAHPEFEMDADQSGSASTTNYVIFGRYNKEPVVFKYFCQDERRAREVYGLVHWAPTGIVSRLYHDEGQRLIVIERFLGSFFARAVAVR